MIPRALAAAAGVLALFVVAAGCSQRGTALLIPEGYGAIGGKVTYNNNPVGGGFVYFVASDGVRHSAQITGDGSYSTTLKEGTYTVTVDTESINPAKKQDYRGQGSGMSQMYGKAAGASGGAAPGAPKGGAKSSPAPEGANVVSVTYVQIPAKYADKSKSGLSVTVKPGMNDYNIPLTD